MTPVIRWDGRLHVCCADVHGEIEVGSLETSRFLDLWDGPRMTQYRIWHILGEFDKMPACARCGGINFYQLGDDEIREYLEQIGRGDLFEAYLERMGRGKEQPEP